MSVNEGVVKLTVEKELGVEIIGDTKIKVSIEDEEDDYEIVTDDEVMTESDEAAIEEIDEEYLK